MKRILIASILMVCAAMGAEAKTRVHKHIGKPHGHVSTDGCALDRVVPHASPGHSHRPVAKYPAVEPGDPPGWHGGMPDWQWDMLRQ